MAHYAFLDESNVVIQVIVGKDEGEDGIDWEQFYANEVGMACKRTSFNTIGGVHQAGGTPFRKNYAGIGFTYDAQRDAFVPPRPFASWLLNEETCLWDAPVPYPSNIGTPEEPNRYTWDEATTAWILVE